MSSYITLTNFNYGDVLEPDKIYEAVLNVENLQIATTPKYYAALNINSPFSNILPTDFTRPLRRPVLIVVNAPVELSSAANTEITMTISAAGCPNRVFKLTNGMAGTIVHNWFFSLFWFHNSTFTPPLSTTIVRFAISVANGTAQFFPNHFGFYHNKEFIRMYHL